MTAFVIGYVVHSLLTLYCFMELGIHRYRRWFVHYAFTPLPMSMLYMVQLIPMTKYEFRFYQKSKLFSFKTLFVRIFDWWSSCWHQLARAHIPPDGHINTLRRKQNCAHFVGDILKYIFLNENVLILIKISSLIVQLTLVEVMAWCGTDDKPLPESLLTHFIDTHMRHQGPVLISDKTSYHKISQSLEATRFVLRIVRSLWNLTGTSAALLPKCLSNF